MVQILVEAGPFECLLERRVVFQLLSVDPNISILGFRGNRDIHFSCVQVKSLGADDNKCVKLIFERVQRTEQRRPSANWQVSVARRLHCAPSSQGGLVPPRVLYQVR